LEFFPKDSIGLPPDFFTFTPPASPGYSAGNASSPARSYHSSLSADGGFPCLSPSRRALDDIPEENSETPNLKLGGLAVANDDEHKIISPARLLWPSATESALASEALNQEFDIFSAHRSGFLGFDQKQSSLTEASSSTP
jgi:regulatory protein SWI5